MQKYEKNLNRPNQIYVIFFFYISTPLILLSLVQNFRNCFEFIETYNPFMSL